MFQVLRAVVDISEDGGIEAVVSDVEVMEECDSLDEAQAHLDFFKRSRGLVQEPEAPDHWTDAEGFSFWIEEI